MKFQIGRAERPESDDPRYETKATAIHDAQVCATGDFVYAVWEWIDDDRADVVCLVYGGDIYTKEGATP